MSAGNLLLLVIVATVIPLGVVAAMLLLARAADVLGRSSGARAAVGITGLVIYVGLLVSGLVQSSWALVPGMLVWSWFIWSSRDAGRSSGE